MLAEQAAVLSVVGQTRLRIEPALREGLEQRRCTVAFAQNEAVALRMPGMLRVDAQHAEVSRNQYIDARKARAQVRRLRVMRVHDGVGANAARERRQLRKREMLDGQCRHGLCW